MVQSLPVSLEHLASHSIFIPPSSSSIQNEEDDWQLVSGLNGQPDDDDDDDLRAPQKISRLVMRGKDLILAFGTEVRIANVGGESWEVREGQVGAYKLALDPTGRLLAVIGRKQVVVLALPRTGSLGNTTGSIAAQAIAIDPIVLSSSASADITKALFHPLGAVGNSLWILTSDGKLREYDIQQPQDPAQTFSIFTTASASSRFSAVDPLARLATSFAFFPPPFASSTATAAAPHLDVFTVHILAANGDIYVLTPIMPLRTVLPLPTLQYLKAATDRQEAAGSSRDGQSGWRSAFVNELVRQAKSARHTRHVNGFSSPSRSTRDSAQQYIAERTVALHPPHLTEAGGPASGSHRQVLRQGPMALDPSPSEADDEDMASDIYVFRAEDGESSDADGEVFVGVAWTSGRVDLGIEVDRPQMRWVSARESTSVPPTLSIVESIALPPPSSSSTGPSIIGDCLHADTFYVLDGPGTTSISVGPLLRDLLGYDDVGSSDISRIASASTSDPVVGTCSLCEISLGYGVLALGQSGKLVAQELDFRVSALGVDPAAPSGAALPASSKSFVQTIADPLSPLVAQQFDLDTHLAAIRRAVPAARSILAKESDRSKPLQTVSPATLKLLGEITSQLHSATHTIRSATRAVESRLDLQLQELARQVSSLKRSRDAIDRLGPKSVVARMEAVAARQVELDGRVKRVMRQIAAEYGPPVSEEERRWFGELEKLRARVQGKESDLSQSLTERVASVKRQIVDLKAARQPHDAEGSGSRSRPLEVAIGARSEEIKQLMRKVDSLNLRIEEVAEDPDSEEEDY